MCLLCLQNYDKYATEQGFASQLLDINTARQNHVLSLTRPSQHHLLGRTRSRCFLKR